MLACCRARRHDATTPCRTRRWWLGQTLVEGHSESLFPDDADFVGHLQAVLEHVQPTVIALM